MKQLFLLLILMQTPAAAMFVGRVPVRYAPRSAKVVQKTIRVPSRLVHGDRSIPDLTREYLEKEIRTCVGNLKAKRKWSYPNTVAPPPLLETSVSIIALQYVLNSEREETAGRNIAQQLEAIRLEQAAMRKELEELKNQVDQLDFLQ